MRTTTVYACLCLLASLVPAPAAALCSEPNLPYCAADGDLDDRFVSREACRRDVERYRERLEVYKRCLSEALTAADAEIERIEKLLSADEEQPRE